MTNDNTTATIPGLVGDNPDWDVNLTAWLPLARRLQDASRGRGHSVVTVHVVVDERGRPLHWGEPTVCHIEPKAKGEALEALLRALAGTGEGR